MRLVGERGDDMKVVGGLGGGRVEGGEEGGGVGGKPPMRNAKRGNLER